jgi:lipopolysaccharide biosynthesis glycosyltransferase
MYINIAFCFDHNLIRQVQVAAASLLDHTGTDQVHYHIYCICTKEASQAGDRLRRLVKARDRESSVIVKVVENLYQDAYEVRGISSGAYLRLMLHRLLPELDKILYTDVDVLFRDDLTEIWQTDLTDYVLAAVKGTVNCSDKWEWNSDRPYWHWLEDMKGKYINSGVLLLNLAEVRRRNLEEEWSKWAKERLYYQDQDILNLTCKGAILYLPLKYNRFAYIEEDDYDAYVSEGIFTGQECAEASNRPVIIHYAGDKPWKRYDTNLGYLWWDYVNSQPGLQGMFDEEKARKYHGPTLLERGIRKLRKIVSKEKL